MNSKDLEKWIDSLTDDIEFCYQGVDGSICPFSRDNISVSYGDYEKTHNCIEDVMQDPFLAGKSLYDISEKLEFGL